MGSNIYATKCPNCGRSAIEDYYYKTDEFYTYCMRCGYYHEKTIESYTKGTFKYKEEISAGHGMFVLVNKDGSRKRTLLDSTLTDEHLENFQAAYLGDTVDKDKSYLVTFKNGEFTILLGNPPENFHLSFEDYKAKMVAKYGRSEFEFMVPIEE